MIGGCPVKANNYHGYIVMYREGEPAGDAELSSVIGKPRGEWHTTEPMVIYPEIQQLIDAVPGFNKRTHVIGEVVVHLLSERVEILTA